MTLSMMKITQTSAVVESHSVGRRSLRDLSAERAEDAYKASAVIIGAAAGWQAVGPLC